MLVTSSRLCSFMFMSPAPTEIYPLSLHDSLPICGLQKARHIGGLSLATVQSRREMALFTRSDILGREAAT